MMQQSIGIWEEGRGNDSAYSRFLEWSEVDGSNAADSDDNYISVPSGVNEKLINFVIIPTCLTI